ncbi:MAG TPA: ribonuclease III [Thermomicrobiales bacterium]|nr:ribonuclease III [Thermomicrobiales bacterium]
MSQADPSAVPALETEALPDRDEALRRFASRLRLKFRNPDLLRLALTHRSVLNDLGNELARGAAPASLMNERLEFLGDAVLGLVAADYLYAADADADEGALTRRRVALVRTETLVRWARELGLGDVLQLGQGERPSDSARDRMLSGAFEALIGAIALDRGYPAAQKFVRRFLDRDADALIEAGLAGANPKGRLQEALQGRYQVGPTYRVLATEGPDHDRTFTVEASVHGTSLGVGVGASKREAEQNAAEAALATLAADTDA